MNLERYAPLRAVVSRRPLTAQALNRHQLLIDSFASRHLVQASDNANILEAAGNPSYPHNVSLDRQYDLQDGAQCTSATTTEVVAPSAQKPASFGYTNFRQQSARMFMLQCRTRSPSTRRRNPLESMISHTKDFSTTPVADLNTSDSTTIHHKLHESKSEVYAYASMVTTNGEVPKLKLRLAKDTSVDYRVSDGFGEMPKIQTVHEIDISETLSISRAVRVEAGVTRGENIKRDVERRIRGDTSSISWTQILQKLEERTSAIPAAGLSLKMHGSEFDLIELHHMLLSDPTYDVVLYHPVSTNGRSIMLLLGTEKNIEDVITLVKTDKEWARLGVGMKRKFSSHSMLTELREELGIHKSENSRSSQHIEDLHRPRAWTKRNLSEFLRAVTASRPPQVLRQGKPHKDVVEAILVDLLYNSPDLRAILSWSALHLALSFLVKHGKTMAARELMGHMERNGFTPNVETFNIILSGCAEEQNISAFNYHVNLMYQENIQPNDGSWVALMIAAPTLEAQKFIARKMFQMGFAIKPTFGRENAPQIVPYSFAPFLDTGGTIADYIKTLDDIYGRNWLHAAAVVKLVATLASRGRYISAIEMVKDFALNRNYTVTDAVVHILLRHCVRHANADLAIWIMVYFNCTWKTRTVDHIIPSLLFAVAWKSRMFNVVRTAWKYTSVAGEARFEMRKLIHSSLLGRLKPTRKTVRGRWHATAGSVACGVDPLAVPHLTPDSIMKSEKALFGRTPVFPFTLQMIKALILDKAWTADQVKATRGLTWMLRNTIQIPLTPTQPVLRKIFGSEQIPARQGRVRRFRRNPKTGILYRNTQGNESDGTGGQSRW